MEEQLTIRKYNARDKEEVLTLLRLNTPAYFAEVEESDLQDYLEHESADYYVMEKDGILVGSGGFNRPADTTMGIISWDIFHPEYQGRGFGRKLLRFRIREILESSDIKKIRVRTSQLAEDFYRKNGFQLVYIVAGYWAPGYDLYSMELFITDAIRKEFKEGRPNQ